VEILEPGTADGDGFAAHAASRVVLSRGLNRTEEDRTQSLCGARGRQHRRRATIGQTMNGISRMSGE
jgi:hypothetical protein